MLRQFMWIACALLLGLSSSEVAAADTPVDLKKHRPRFHWKTGPDGRQSIYDGEMLVADFYPGPKAMHGIGRPISLHNLRLIPGGQLAIANGEGCGPLCLSWRKHLIFYMKIDELSVDEKDPKRLKLYVKSHDVGLRNDGMTKPVSMQPSWPLGWTNSTNSPRIHLSLELPWLQGSQSPGLCSRYWFWALKTQRSFMAAKPVISKMVLLPVPLIFSYSGMTTVGHGLPVTYGAISPRMGFMLTPGEP